MSIDRYKLLLGWHNAKRAAADPRLPEHIRAGFRKARDHAAVALGMMDAEARAKGTPREKTSSSGEKSPPK